MAGNLTNKDKKALALELYLNTDKNGKEICAIAHVTEKTFGKWKNDGDWELLKSAQTITAHNIISNLYQKAYEESLKDDINADKLAKLAATIEKLSDRKVTVSNTINVFREFTKWAFDAQPELAKQINTLQGKFVDFKINEK
tara:strand:- start:29529 stop:29954 length:426 start_codon:yes stop_codon:yes gene_type:complete